MRFLLGIFLFLVFSPNTMGQSKLDRTLKKLNTESIPYISLKEAAHTDSVLYLDTRKKQEYDVSHLQNAIWVGYEMFDARDVQDKIPDKNAEIIVYCSIGVRSEDIGEKLVKLGYPNVKNLYGGIFEWKNKGYPVYDDQGKETEKVHAFDEHWGKLLKAGEKVYD
ncbi:rhodanese-like domain-containing protein [Ulvibacterium sp.]|uniref:rhodanese-like domain-containing protein n=1 Tax=Ulvibacterium sp. TaxID=2665914 RepID=UPI003BA85BC7